CHWSSDQSQSPPPPFSPEAQPTEQVIDTVHPPWPPSPQLGHALSRLWAVRTRVRTHHTPEGVSAAGWAIRESGNSESVVPEGRVCRSPNRESRMRLEYSRMPLSSSGVTSYFRRAMILDSFHLGLINEPVEPRLAGCKPMSDGLWYFGVDSPPGRASVGLLVS